MSTKKIALICVTLLLLVFSLSLFFYIYKGSNWVRRVLFFPEFGSEKLSGEERFLPNRKNMEEDVSLLISELILGPGSQNHEQILPKDVRIKLVIARKGTVYVDFSQELVFVQSKGLDEMIHAAANTILFNFPRIKRLFIYIEGQIPGDKYAEGVEYSPDVIK